MWRGVRCGLNPTGLLAVCDEVADEISAEVVADEVGLDTPHSMRYVKSTLDSSNRRKPAWLSHLDFTRGR